MFEQSISLVNFLKNIWSKQNIIVALTLLKYKKLSFYAVAGLPVIYFTVVFKEIVCCSQRDDYGKVSQAPYQTFHD